MRGEGPVLLLLETISLQFDTCKRWHTATFIEHRDCLQLLLLQRHEVFRFSCRNQYFARFAEADTTARKQSMFSVQASVRGFQRWTDSFQSVPI